MEEQIRNYQKILKANPSDLPAFTALEEIFKGKDRFKDLVKLYEQRLKHTQDPEQHRILLEKSALVWHLKLDDPNRAVKCYHRLLQVSPNHIPALEGLQDVYRFQKRWTQLAWVMEQLALLTEDKSQRAEIDCQLGILYLNTLKLKDRALVSWGHALAADPQRVDVLEALQHVYLELGYFRKVFSLIDHEQGLAAAENNAVGEKYLGLAQHLLSEPLFEQVCRDCLTRAQELLQDPQPAKQTLEILEKNLSDWEATIKRLRVEAVEAPDKGRAVSLYRQIAEIYFLRGEHEKQVEENLDKCALLQPGNPRLLGFIEHYYISQRRAKDAIDRFYDMVSRVKNQQTQADILERIAILAAVHLQDKESAIRAYERIVQIRPGHEAATAALVEFFQEEGRWAEVVELLKNQAERLGDLPEKAEVLGQVARITAERLKDPDAARFLYEEILRIDPENLPAAKELERNYVRTGNYDGLAGCIEIELKHVHDGKERLKLLDRLVDLHLEKRSQPLDAYNARMRSLTIAPARKKSLKELLVLGEQTGRFQETAAALQSAIDTGKLTGEVLEDVLKNLAEIHEQRLNQPTLAIKYYQELLDKDPKNLAALESLERLQKAAGGSVELVAIYQHQLTLVQPDEKKKKLLTKLAEIYTERMADFSQAIQAYRQVLEMDQDDPDAWSALGQLYEREGLWGQAADALLHSLEGLVDPLQRASLQYRLAVIYEQRLNDAEKALGLCNEILATDDVDSELAALTVTVLERLHGRGVSPLRIAEILQPYYALAGDWRRHIEMLEMRLEGCNSIEERIQLLERIAQVYEEELSQKELAFSAYGRAFSQMPENASLLEVMLRLADETGRTEELAGFLEKSLHHAQQEQIAALSLKLGELYRDRLNRQPNAIAAYQRVLENEPGNTEALQSLASLYRATQRFDELVAVLNQRIDSTDELQQKKELLLELGVVVEQELHDRPRAIEVYQQLDQMLGEDLDVLKRMEILLEKEGRWPELAEILERMITLVPPDQASDLNLKLGRVRAERMEDRENALEHYRQVLEERPEDSRAIEALESLLERPDIATQAAEILQPIYEKRADFAGLVRVLEVEADTALLTDKKIDVLLRIAQIYDRKLSAAGKSIAALRRAFRIDTTRTDVLESLERQCANAAAFDVLTTTLEEALSGRPERELQVMLLPKLANLYRDELRRPDLAMASLRRLLEVEPYHAKALASLEALYREANSYQDLAWVLELQAEATADLDTKRDLWVQTAQIREEQLGDLEGAASVYGKVFESDPSDMHAGKQLDRLYQATSRWEDATKLLPQLAALAKNTLGKIEYSSRLAAIYTQHLDQPRQAIQILRHILELKPNHPETIVQLEKLLVDERCRLPAAEVLDGIYRSNGEWPKLVAIIEIRMSASADPSERLSFYQQLMNLFEYRMEERAQAFKVAKRAFREQPEDEGVQRDLNRLAQEGNFFEELVVLYQDIAQRNVGSQLAYDLQRQIATLYEQELGQRDRAMQEWEKLSEIDPTDQQVLAALERLYREKGDFAPLVRIYLRQVDLTDELERKKDLLFQAAATLAEGVQSTDEAVNVYRRILELDAQDKRALKLLDQLLVMAGRFEDLIPVLQSQVDLAPMEIAPPSDADTRVELLLRMAQIQKDKLSDSPAALRSLQLIFQRRPTEKRAVELLEQMLTDSATRMEAAELLEPYYRYHGDNKNLVQIIQVRLDTCEDKQQRMSLYRDLMDIYETELTQKPFAFTVACRAFRENTEDEGIRQELERLASETGYYEELAGVYDDLLTKGELGTVQADIERRLAQLKESYLEEKEEAVSHWRQVLASDPDDQEALKSLERLYRERSAYSELVGILRHQASLEEDLDKRKDLYHEVATLMEERLGRNDGAIEAYREILTDDPNDLAVLKLLDRLLEKGERWDELADILRAQIRRASSSEIVPLNLRLADLMRNRLARYDETAAIYAEVLSINANHPAATEALVNMFELGQDKLGVAKVLVDVLSVDGDWRHLIAALEVTLEASEDPMERKDLLSRIASIYQQREMQELAFHTFGQAFQEDPSDEKLRLTLEQLAAQTEEFELLAAIYQRRLDGLVDRDILLTLHKRLATIFANRLDEPPKALGHMLEVVRLDPEDASSLAHLEEFYRRQEDYEALASILSKRLRLATDPRQACDILYEIGSIYEQQLSDVGSAISTYQRILEYQPDDMTALNMLENLCRQQGRLRDLAQVLVTQVNVYDKASDVTASLDKRFQLAQLYEQEFGDPGRAGQLYQDILRVDPSHVQTVQHLEAQMAEGRSIDNAGELLEASYEKTGDWKKYLDILESQVRQSRVMARRIELMQEIARIQEEKMDMSLMAFNTYVRMFHEDLTNSKVRAGLERLATLDDNLEALAAVYEEELDNIEEPDVGFEMALKVARIQLDNLQDTDEAERFFKLCLRFDPRNLEALQELELLLERREQWEDLVGVLSKMVDLVSDQEQIRVLFRLGNVLLEHLEQSDKAIVYFRRVLDLDPTHLESLKMLERAFAQQDDHEALYEVLQSHLELVEEPTGRLELVARIADLADQNLDRPDEAIELWQRIREEDPDNQDAFDALSQLFENTSRWTDLAELIEERMATTADPEKIADLSSRLGWVKGEKLGELEDAMKHWQEVLRLDPKNQVALQSLRDIYSKGGHWEELLSVLRKLVPLQSEMTEVKTLRFELAEILGEKLERHDQAIEAGKRALDIEPHSLSDLQRLARIFEANEAWSEAVGVLEMSAERLEVQPEKIEILLEIASIWKDRIQRPLGAAPAYEKILEMDPLNEEAYRSCIGIYNDSKEWRRLTALYEVRLGNIRERKDRLDLIKEIAEIYERRLGQKELAFARYCAAFREDFSDDMVLVKLEQLAKETEDYETLLEVLEDATEEVTSGRRAVGLLHKVADIYRHQMGDPDKAEEFLSRAIKLDKREIASLDSLAELYEEQGRYDALVKLLETKYERSDELEERKQIRAQIARIREEHLENVEGAIESLRRILELDGRDEQATQSLIRIYQQEGRWHELISMLRRAADQAQERQVAINYLYNIATIWETELGSDEDAIDAYQNVVEFESTHLESLKALERIYTRLDRWNELLRVFEKQVELISESEEKIKIYTKMGAIWEERFSDIEKAAYCHDQILSLDEHNLSAIKALERLIRRMNDFPRLIDLYERHLELVDDPTELVGINLSIGDVWYHELNRVDKAEDAYDKALEINNQSREAIHALGQLYEKSGNWFNAIEMLKREAELCGATPQAVDLYYRMGKINEDMLMDQQAARDSYTQALTVDPSYLPAIKALKLIYYLDKEFDAYLDMMAQEAEYTEDLEEKAGLYYEIGKFLQEQRDDSLEASRFYEESLKLTPDFLPAAKPLADIYFRSEQWEQAEQMMEVVVGGLDRNTESKELCRQYYRLGYITEKLGKEEKALEHYRMSYELDATYLPALEGLGNALLKTEQWEEAYRIYQTILIHHRDSLSDAEVAELYWQIGDVSFQKGEVERAVDSFMKALDIDESHLASMQYLLRIHEQQENWEEAYEYGMQMADFLDGEELLEHRLHMAQMCRENLQDPFRAADSLQAALRIDPQNVKVLNQIKDVYLETRQYSKTVEVIEEIIGMEGRPRKLVELHVQAAELLKDELRDDLRAVEHYNRALDIDPSKVKAFENIYQILSSRKRWQELKENFILMIKRLPASAPKTKLALWKDLGELCRVVLRNRVEAIDAYKMITTMDPEDVDALATLGDLLAAKQDGIDEALTIHHQVVAKAADRYESYRTLRRLYNTQKKYDQVYVFATLLKYLKRANQEDLKIVNYFSKRAPKVAARPVNDRVWEMYLAHPGVRNPLTRIFGLMYRMATSMFVVEHRDVGLKKRDHQVDLARDRSFFANIYRTAAKVLGGLDVELFALKDQQADIEPGLALALTRPTAFIAYRDVFQIDKKKMLLFQVGRQLAMTRPEFILASTMPLSELNNLLQAACLLVKPSHNAEGDMRSIERARVSLKRALTEQGLGVLKRAVFEYLKSPSAFNLKRWVEAIEHSVNRAGLIVGADLPVCLSILRRDVSALTPMRPVTKVTEMLKFASSIEYFELREKLGLNINV